MKKGKRQVIEKKIFQEDGQYGQSQVKNYVTNFSNQSQPVKTRHIASNHIETPAPAIIASQIPIKNNIDKLSNSTQELTVQNSSQNDERKKKIELLKQKYLKKNQAVINSPTIVKQNITLKQNSQKKTIQTINNQRKVQPISNKYVENNIKINQNIKINNPINGNQKIIDSKFYNDDKINNIPQTLNNKFENHTYQQNQSNDRNFYQNLNHSCIPSNQRNQIEKQIIETQTRKLEAQITQTKNREMPKIPSIPLAPTVQKKNVPPPPNNMKKIVQRKFEQKSQQQQNQKLNQKNDFIPVRDPFSLTGNYELLVNQNHKQQQRISQDNLRVSEKSIVHSYSNNESQNNISLIDSRTAYFKWISQGQSVLSYLYDSQHPILFPQKNIQPSYQSQNPSLNPYIKDLINKFIIHNMIELSQSQKSLCHNIILQYYYNNPNNLSDIFLIILIKLGNEYLYKYSQTLLLNLLKYIQIILRYKHLFLKSQLESFCNFCLELDNNINQDKLIMIFMLLPKCQKILQKIYSFKFESDKNIITILCLNKPQKNNQASLMVYLKIINGIIQKVKFYGILEKILQQFKQIEFTEKIYPISKDIKLKIIKQISNLHQQSKQNNNNNNNNNQKAQSDGGFFGYFNKAIDKIKTTVPVIQREPPKNQKSNQPAIKEDVIVYDQVLKRYRINGQIPKDEDQMIYQDNQEQGKRKVPPPPPPKAGGRVPIPPGNKKRVVTNRYS